jgi:hypothetical protein
LHHNKLYGGGIIGDVDSGFLPVCVQVPTTTTSTVFAVGGNADHSSY